MPFDPKIVRPDEASFADDAELQLQGDLAFLADQLRDDAQRLASCYPARVDDASGAEVAVLKRGMAWKWTSRGIVGTGLASALIGLGLVVWQLNTGEPQPAAGRPDPSNVFLSISPAPSNVAPASAASDDQPLRVTPASWLGDTTGPELEALMDLWEQEDREVAGLSF